MYDEERMVEGTLKLEEILRQGPGVEPLQNVDPSVVESIVGPDPLYNEARRVASEEGILRDGQEKKGISMKFCKNCAQITWFEGRYKLQVLVNPGFTDRTGEVLATHYVKKLNVQISLGKRLGEDMGHALIAEIDGAGMKPELILVAKKYYLDLEKISRETRLVEGITPFDLMRRTCPEISVPNIKLLELLENYFKDREWVIQRSGWWPGNVHRWIDIGIPKHDSPYLPAELEMYPARGLFGLRNYDRRKRNVLGIDITQLPAYLLEFDPKRGNELKDVKVVVYFCPRADREIRLVLVREENRHSYSLEQTMFIPTDGRIKVMGRTFEEKYYYSGVRGVIREITDAFGANRPARKRYGPGYNVFFI